MIEQTSISMVGSAFIATRSWSCAVHAKLRHSAICAVRMEPMTSVGLKKNRAQAVRNGTCTSSA